MGRLMIHAGLQGLDIPLIRHIDLALAVIDAEAMGVITINTRYITVTQIGSIRPCPSARMASRDPMLDKYCASIEYFAEVPEGVLSRSKGSTIFKDAAMISQKDLMKTARMGAR